MKNTSSTVHVCIIESLSWKNSFLVGIYNISIWHQVASCRAREKWRQTCWRPCKCSSSWTLLKIHKRCTIASVVWQNIKFNTFCFYWFHTRFSSTHMKITEYLISPFIHLYTIRHLFTSHHLLYIDFRTSSAIHVTLISSFSHYSENFLGKTPLHGSKIHWLSYSNSMITIWHESIFLPH